MTHHRENETALWRRASYALVLGSILCVELWSARARAQAIDQKWAAAPSEVWNRAQLLGDMGGLRPALSDHGVTLELQEISEELGHTTAGGTGAHYEGVTMLDLNMDSGQAFHWSGGLFNLSVLQIHGPRLSGTAFNDFQHQSGIEASRATRLWELWYQQTLIGGKVDIRVGQQSLDQEFIANPSASVFVSMMMGWPMLPAADLYGGGPAFPLSSLGVRLRGQVAPAWTLLAGVFDDNPPDGPLADDSQDRGAEASGTRFSLNTGALWIAELQYFAHVSPGIGCNSIACRLPGSYKLGAWYDTADFPDQRFDASGLPLADPAGSGVPRTDRGNFSLYAVADQMVWRQPHGPRTICVFARLMGAPSDRNLMDLSMDAGLVVNAPLAGRGVFGMGFGWTHVSNSASELNRDTERFTGKVAFVRRAERFVELTYQYPLAPWWQLQPDLQYLDNPGGGVPDPHDPSRWLGRELVFGLRTTVSF